MKKYKVWVDDHKGDRECVVDAINKKDAWRKGKKKMFADYGDMEYSVELID